MIFILDFHGDFVLKQGLGEIVGTRLNTREILLCLLLNGPMAGYDIKKTLDGDVAGVLDIRISNLYPLLNELADSGLVNFILVEQINRPNKKVYDLTDAGRTLCINSLLKCEVRQRFRSELLFLLQFARLMPGSRIEALLDGRICELRGYLDELTHPSTHKTNAYHSFKLGLAKTVLQAEVEYIADNRHLLARHETNRKRGAAKRA